MTLSGLPAGLWLTLPLSYLNTPVKGTGDERMPALSKIWASAVGI